MIDYNYTGALEPIKVKVIQFNNGAPDLILSVEEWNQEGGWRGLIKGGAINLRDVTRVIDGTMCPLEFEALEAWEG